MIIELQLIHNTVTSKKTLKHSSTFSAPTLLVGSFDP